jgi:hypothetical protein
MQLEQTFDAQDTWFSVPVFPLPDESAVVVPWSSLKSQSAIKPELRLAGALTVRETGVETAIPGPVPATMIVEEPDAAVVEADSVSVVLQVAMQFGVENAAVTPTGKGAAENDTERGRPDISVAVTPSGADWPCIRDSVGAVADNEIAVGMGAVVKL